MKKLFKIMPVLLILSCLWLMGASGGTEKYCAFISDMNPSGCDINKNESSPVVEKLSSKDSATIAREIVMDKLGINTNLVVNKDLRKLFQDSKGNFWFGTSDYGLIKYNGDKFNYFTKKEGLAGLNITGIIEDQIGNLWISTNEGISKYDGASFVNYTVENGLNSNSVWSIYQDKKGVIWAGTYDGLCKFDGVNFQTVELPFDNARELNTGWENKMIHTILEDRKGDLWIGTDSYGLFKYDGESFKQFSETEGFNGKTVLNILEDSKGNIWFGTLKGGLIQYDGNSFNRLMDEKISEVNRVWTMKEDKAGNIWFNSRREGLFRYDGTTFTKFDNSNGLMNIRVSSILEDTEGRIWLGTAMGLHVYYENKIVNLSGFTGEGC